MSDIDSENLKANLALALVGGTRAADWAKANGVSERTVCRWSRSPEVREQVDAIRREFVDRAINRYCEKATAAADQVIKLAEEANSESVRLHASRAILSGLMAVSNYSSIERRMSEVERRLKDRSQRPAADPRFQPTSPVGPETAAAPPETLRPSNRTPCIQGLWHGDRNRYPSTA